MTAAGGPAPPAGWYPDPESPGAQRYWDGARWAAPAAGPEVPAAVGQPDQSARQWAMGAHLSALVAMLIGFAFLGPLVVLLVKGNDHPFVRQQALEALNFNLSWLLYGVVGGIITVLLMLLVVGVLLIPVLIAGAVAWLVLIVVASMRANGGEPYRYPLTIRFFT